MVIPDLQIKIVIIIQKGDSRTIFNISLIRWLGQVLGMDQAVNPEICLVLGTNKTTPAWSAKKTRDAEQSWLNSVR